MRLFVAINFNTETRSRLISIRDELRSQSVYGNFSLDENLHLTLAFIGECSLKKIDKIKAILETVTFDPFDVEVERLGTFSSGHKGVPGKSKDFLGQGAATERASFSPLGGNEQPQSAATWWAGLREDKPLMMLQREIEHKLALCGFPMDGRKYSPHVTLGREVITAIKPWKIEPFGDMVSAIDLMKSERITGKLTYTPIFTRENKDAIL